MKAVILLLVLLAATLGALWGYGRKTGAEISWRAVANFGDAALSAYLAKYPEGNKINQYLSDRAGQCAFNDRAVFLPGWKKIEGPFLFSVPLDFVPSQDLRWALRCKDSIGNEFWLEPMHLGRLQVDRMVAEPLRLTLYPGARVRVKSNGLRLLLPSPRGDLLLQASAKSTLVFAATGNRPSNEASDLEIIVEEGSLKITAENPDRRDDGHILELRTRQGEIKWGPNEEKIGPGSWAQVLPSGLHRR